MPLHPTEHPALVRLANAHRSEVPEVPDPNGRPRSPRRLDVWGVGTDWVQVTWSRLGPGTVRFRLGDRPPEDVVVDGGPGSHVLEGLTAATRHRIDVSGAGITPNDITLTATTLTPPPGEELFRIATVSDVHLGCDTTGYLHTIAEIPTPAVPHTIRCLRAAQTEASFWGAERLVVKGDLVDRSDRETWAVAADVLAALSVPVDILPGNHERSKVGDVDPYLGASEVGLDLVDGVRAIDVDGARLVFADTTRPGTDIGQIDAADDIVSAAGASSGPALVFIHHQLIRHVVPTYLPIGVPRPAARRFLKDLGRANERSIVSSGHTHRHRRYDVGPVTVTEVGSTKDFPGTWAGYQVYEGGIVQTVRRTGEPSVIRWTDHTRRAALGIWGRWAPGPMTSRCFARRW